MKGKLANGTEVEIRIGNKVTTIDGWKGHVHMWGGENSFVVILKEPIHMAGLLVPIIGFRCVTEDIVSIDGNYSDDYKPTPVQLKVVAVSSNTNSFGLYNQIFFTSDGKAYQASANEINVLKRHDVLTVPDNTENAILNFFVTRGFELGEQLSTPPLAAIKEVFPDYTPKE